MFLLQIDQLLSSLNIVCQYYNLLPQEFSIMKLSPYFYQGESFSFEKQKMLPLQTGAYFCFISFLCSSDTVSRAL